MAQRLRRRRKRGSYWVKHGKCAQRVALFHMIERLELARKRLTEARNASTKKYDSVVECFERERRRWTKELTPALST